MTTYTWTLRTLAWATVSGIFFVAVMTDHGRRREVPWCPLEVNPANCIEQAPGGP